MTSCKLAKLAAMALATASLPACSSSQFSSADAKRAVESDGAANSSTETETGTGTASQDDKTDAAAAAKQNPTGTKTGTGQSSGSGTGSGTATGITSGGSTVKPPNIRIGMLVNDLNCTFCHLEVHGDVGSVTTVAPFRFDSHGQVFGRWLVNGAFNAAADLSANNAGAPPLDNGIQVGQLLTSYNNSGHELPVDASGTPTFPTIDFTTLQGTVAGSLSSPATGSTVASIAKVLNGNAVLVGTSAKPIHLDGDVLIQGDLVITGVYTGIGTIYVTGNIYIPSNLTAANKASFPYPDPVNGDYSAADKQAQADVQAGKDALGLASQHNIFVADIENYMDSSNGATGKSGLNGAAQYISLYDYTDTVAGGAGLGAGSLLSPRTSVGIEGVYSWYPESQFQSLYQSVTPCWTSSNRVLVTGHSWGERAVNEVDAFLYAAEAIGGVSRATNWTINGGMIAQVMHIISGAGSDSIAANATCPASRINYDYRMRNQLPLLDALAPFFPSQ